MKLKTLIVFCLFLTAFSFVDIAPNPISANGIYTIEDCKIRMESEIIEVDLFPEKSIVSCTFEMINYGDATSLEVGFPVMDFDYWNFGGYTQMDKANFEIQVDNKTLSKKDIKVPKQLDSLYQEFMTIINLEKEHKTKIDSTYRSHNVEYRKDGSLIFPKDLKKKKMQEAIDSIHNFYWERTSLSSDLISEFQDLTENGKFPWYVWDVSFKENETRTIKVNYVLPSGLAGKNAFRYFKYILKTGSGWYKDIGKADIILKLNDIDFESIDELKPNNYLLDKESNRILWRFENLEPTEKDDIYLQYTIPIEKRKYHRWKKKMDRKYKN